MLGTFAGWFSEAAAALFCPLHFKVGLALAKRFPASELLPYIAAQVVVGIIAAALLYFIASGKAASI